MKLMQVWIVCSVVFFVAAELYQWLQGITLPMPVFVVAGALLAVASNAQIFFQKQSPLQSLQPLPQADSTAVSATSVSTTLIPPETASSQSTAPPPRYYPGAQLPSLTPAEGRSISFKVQKGQKGKSVSEAKNLGKDKA